LEELRKHGYNVGLTATEYSLKLIDELASNVPKADDYKELRQLYENIVNKLFSERPTSAQASNMLRDIGLIILKGIKENIDVKKTKKDIVNALDSWKKKVIKECEEAALIASRRLIDGDVILTHSRSLCVLKALEYAKKEGKKLSVYVTESRPGMEGLVTAEKIAKLGFNVKLIVDSAVRFFMKDVDKVLLGAEAVAVNGATVSKVGSSLISLIASEARVRVFVIAPITKFNIETLFGELVKLPEGDWRRLMSVEVYASMPENYRARVPLFDVTPPSYIDGIATEKGFFAPQALPVIMKEVYGSWPPKLVSIEEILNALRGEQL